LARDETWERIQRTGQLRVAMDASYPPFEWIDEDGQFVGYDVDLASALGKRWGVSVQLMSLHFDGLYDAMLADKCDIIVSALPHDPMLTRDVLFSQSYFDAGIVILAMQGGGEIKQRADLRGRRVAVELGSEAHQLARRLTRDDGLDLTILARRTAKETLDDLASGVAELVFCDRVVALGYLGAYPDLLIVGPPLAADPYVIAAPFRARELMTQINQALEAWRAEGYLEELAARWF
jgi:polar amino acid transport system substrate-binding protein